ncbi:hypothetical protein SAMD00019534_123770 [Acytostelium subglobosum LB1]|uniref:hypothetical protein n=1 Tax=Acytostelium subglobosum LB1 TaxID=1410327 RepID=UPI000644B6B9|nr:hypothetical protein SAMD00019534_123770 [Acytostelium subglobosum LB1]GAM29201.1 hypothetical protein SAMD00019534_123770 [Acytostelium subglobosum LB1]|eukprot:XP_012747892.1 hypothetical protein SAMD00019534_123770 [Acytostelium subglobosum LB1]
MDPNKPSTTTLPQATNVVASVTNNNNNNNNNSSNNSSKQQNLYQSNGNDNDGLPDGSDAFRIILEDLEFGPQIGKGAYGKIFKGEYFGTPVGIKEITLSPNNSQYKDLIKFIKREVAMLRFSHPNLVQFIGVAEKGQTLYIVTEFVTGGDLAYYLFKNKNEDTDAFMNRKVNIGSSSTPDIDTMGERLVSMSWPLRIKIAYDVACAMAYLHSRHVIHRDLKSTNLLVCESWKIKVCDFGFARTAGLNGRAKRTMTICGTNNWMAPEVILGQDYNETCDVFSYGIVLSEIITRLETTSNMRPLSLRYGLDVDILLPLVPKDCPPPFLKLALDCTEYDPDLRPTFKEITERLKSLTKRLAVTAILPPLRVLAPSPMASPHVSVKDPRDLTAASPRSICDDDDDSSDLDSDDSDDVDDSEEDDEDASYSDSDDDEEELEELAHNSKSNNNGSNSSSGSNNSKDNINSSDSSGGKSGSGNNNNNNNNIKQQSSKQPTTNQSNKMGYIIKHSEGINITSTAISPSSSLTRHSPVSFSPPSSANTSKSPSPTNLSPKTPNNNNNNKPAAIHSTPLPTTNGFKSPKNNHQSPLRQCIGNSDLLPAPTLSSLLSGVSTSNGSSREREDLNSVWSPVASPNSPNVHLSSGANVYHSPSLTRVVNS